MRSDVEEINDIASPVTVNHGQDEACLVRVWMTLQCTAIQAQFAFNGRPQFQTQVREERNCIEGRMSLNSCRKNT